MENYQDQVFANEHNQRSKLCDQTLRIIKIMEEHRMNATQFSDVIGIQRAAMSHLITGRNKPSADVITRIVERFDTINPRWLLSGKGNMKINPEDNAGSSKENNRYVSSNVNSYVNNEIKTINENSQDLNRSDTGSGSEPDLFSNNTRQTPFSGSFTSSEANKRSEVRFVDEISEGKEIKNQNSDSKIIEKEVVIYKERPNKTINKLLIFYSDNTYETFIPEQH